MLIYNMGAKTNTYLFIGAIIIALIVLLAGEVIIIKFVPVG